MRLSPNTVVGLMGLAGIAILAVILLLLALDLRNQIERDAQRDVSGEAYLLADHAKRLFEVADVALRGASAQTENQSWDAIAASKDLYERLRTLKSALPYIQDIWLNDPTGELRLTTFAFPSPHSNAADRDIFKAQIKPTDRLFVGERIIGRITGKPTFLLARRLSNPDGSFRGMVSVTADLGYFDDYWSSIRLPLDGRVTLLRAAALDVLAQYPQPAQSHSFVRASEAFRAAVAAAPKEGQATLIGGDGQRRVVAYRQVGDLPLVLAVSVSEEAVAAAWRARVLAYLPFALAATLAFAVLAVLGFRQARSEARASRVLANAREALAASNRRLEGTVAERTAALLASEGQLRLILESAADTGIVSTDLGGTITQWNEGARNIFGWEAGETVGQHLRLIFTPEDQAAGVPETEMGTALAKGRASDRRWHHRKDGSRFFAMGTVLPMRGGEGGAPTGFLKVLYDRTGEFEVEEARRTLAERLEREVAERTVDLQSANTRLVAEAEQRRQAEEQLRQSQKMEAVGRLTGGIAHDFNNLLTVVTGNLDLLRRRMKGAGDERAETLVGRAIEGANRAAALTYRLLAFSRQHPLAPVPIDANKLIAGMSDLLNRTLGENIHVEIVLGGGLWRTHADPNQLENALLNLAVNARDAMPDGGKLTIETQNAHLDETYAAARPEVTPGQYVMIAVADTGGGMTDEVMAKAFEPFFTTKAAGKGTGLGLSQVFGFVKQSSGHAAIYSEEGHGTTVKLYLPRFRQRGGTTHAGAMPATETTEAKPAPGRGETILVVEDEAMVREFSTGALEEAGYRVLAAEDGPSGLALLDANPDVALLFTDVVLTGPMNGRAVAEEAVSRRPALKVLFTTGYTRNAIIHHGRLDDGVHLLGKPFTIAEVTAKVRALLDGG